MGILIRLDHSCLQHLLNCFFQLHPSVVQGTYKVWHSSGRFLASDLFYDHGFYKEAGTLVLKNCQQISLRGKSILVPVTQLGFDLLNFL